MQHDEIIEQIMERLHGCADESLLDFILTLLIESGY